MQRHQQQRLYQATINVETELGSTTVVQGNKQNKIFGSKHSSGDQQNRNWRKGLVSHTLAHRQFVTNLGTPESDGWFIFMFLKLMGCLMLPPILSPIWLLAIGKNPGIPKIAGIYSSPPLNGNVTCTIISPSLMAKSPSISTSHGFDAELAVSRSSAACVMACVKCSQMWQQFKSTALGSLKACQMSGYHSFKKIQTCLQMACNMLCNHFAKRIKIGLWCCE